MNLNNLLSFDDIEDSKDLFKSLNFEEFEKTPRLSKKQNLETDISLESFLSFSSLCESDDLEIIESLIQF